MDRSLYVPLVVFVKEGRQGWPRMCSCNGFFGRALNCKHEGFPTTLLGKAQPVNAQQDFLSSKRNLPHQSPQVSAWMTIDPFTHLKCGLFEVPREPFLLPQHILIAHCIEMSAGAAQLYYLPCWQALHNTVKDFRRYKFEPANVIAISIFWHHRGITPAAFCPIYLYHLPDAEGIQC